ncbi:hypothetical protein ACKKBG_A08865 [Auxenochlorella protothecoides x Auxenochlorella symbiontica]
MRSLATHALSYWKLLPRGWEGGGTLRCLRCMQRGFRAEAGMRVRQTEMLRPLRALHAGQRACQDLSRDFGKRDFQSAPAAAGNDFDWRQSVVLAGASFEAYFELAHKTNAVHINTNDACITYVDETFLRQCMDGLLHVELLRATGLPSEELWDVSNRVYCTVELGGSKVETRALEKPAYGGKGVRALLPGPKEEKPSPPPAPKLLFIQDRAKARRLRVKLWRSRLGRPLEALGSGELDLQQGLGGRGGWREVAIALKPDAKEAAGDESSARWARCAPMTWRCTTGAGGRRPTSPCTTLAARASATAASHGSTTTSSPTAGASSTTRMQCARSLASWGTATWATPCACWATAEWRCSGTPAWRWERARPCPTSCPPSLA